MSDLEPDDDVLGELDLDVLDGTAQTAAGLTAAELADQRAVRVLLAGLPDPGPVPPDVVDRITQTLRALSVDDLAPDPGGSGRTVVPIGAARSVGERRPRRVLFAVAAAAVVLAGGGLFASRLVPDVPADSSASSASSGGDRSAEAEKGLTARDLTAAPVVATGTDYHQATLTAQAADLVTGAARDTVADVGKSTSPLAEPQALAACVKGLGAAAGSLLATDLATYDGRPAAILVLRATGGGREVWVVAPDCRPGADGTRSYARLP